MALDQEMKLNTILRVRITCGNKHSEHKHTEIPELQAFWLSPHLISCSFLNLDSAFTVGFYTETSCAAKRMSECYE